MTDHLNKCLISIPCRDVVRNSSMYPPRPPWQVYQLKDTVDNKAWLAPPSHIKTTPSPTEYTHVHSSLFFSCSQRETHENKEIFYRCLAASNFPSGHPWEPYIFTYGKPSLDFMGWIVLGFCEKRRSKILTVCGKTELEWERGREREREDVLILQFIWCDVKNSLKYKVVGCLKKKCIEIQKEMTLYFDVSFLEILILLCNTFPRN